MKQDRFNECIEQVKNKGVEITGQPPRAKRPEEKGRVQKMRAGVENDYGDFKGAIQHDDDIQDDARGDGDFVRASRNE